MFVLRRGRNTTSADVRRRVEKLAPGELGVRGKGESSFTSCRTTQRRLCCDQLHAHRPASQPVRVRWPACRQTLGATNAPTAPGSRLLRTSSTTAAAHAASRLGSRRPGTPQHGVRRGLRCVRSELAAAVGGCERSLSTMAPGRRWARSIPTSDQGETRTTSPLRSALFSDSLVPSNPPSSIAEAGPSGARSRRAC